MPELSIVMPIYNEGKPILETTKNLVKELEKNKINYEIILVNNGSKDDTDKYIKQIIKSNKKFKRVYVKINQGYGWGIINGFKAAKGKYVGYIDSDGQIRPIDVVSCINYIKKNPDVGMCKGVRKQKHGTIQRKFASHIFELLFAAFFFKYVKDINAKPKIMKKEVLKNLNLQSKEWFIDAEIIIKCIRKNTKIGNVEVDVISRKSGKTNVKSKIIFDFVIDLIKARFGFF